MVDCCIFIFEFVLLIFNNNNIIWKECVINILVEINIDFLGEIMFYLIIIIIIVIFFGRWCVKKKIVEGYIYLIILCFWIGSVLFLSLSVILGL